jgi:hypothetical protein
MPVSPCGSRRYIEGEDILIGGIHDTVQFTRGLKPRTILGMLARAIANRAILIVRLIVVLLSFLRRGPEACFGESSVEVEWTPKLRHSVNPQVAVR